eukprot:gene30800-40099_t
MWGANIGHEYILDEHSQIFFPKDYYSEKVQSLRLCKCSICPQTRRDLKALRGHVRDEHNMQLCALCIEHKQVFPAEQRVYTQKEYDTHLRSGDGDGSKGHPNCEFCKKRFYDSNALFFHLSKEHYTCHICDKQDSGSSTRYRYYGQYKDLESHFRRDHFICEEKICLEKKFIVFGNEIDFAAHNRNFHPFLLSNSKVITVHFPSSRRGHTGVEGEEGSAAHVSNTRFEGGLGGRATADGEWLVEIQPSAIARDPRDPNRNNHIRFVPTPASQSNGSTTASTAAAFDPSVLSVESEFPSLAPSTVSGAITLSNKWVTFGGSTEGNVKQKKKKGADFPPLQSETVSYKAASSSSTGGLTVITNGSGKLRPSGSSNNIASGIEQAYLKSSRQSADNVSISKTRWLQEGFSTADRVSMSSAPPPSSEDDSALAWAIAESLKSLQVKKEKEPPPIPPPEKNEPEVFITTKVKPPTHAPLDSEEAYPSLLSTESTVVKPPVGANKTKKAASNIASASGWSSALSAVGLGDPAKKESKVTVVKAKKSSAAPTSLSDKKPFVDSSDQLSSQLYIPPSKSQSQPSEPVVYSISNWTKAGGASDLPEPPVNVTNPPPPQPDRINKPEIDMSDFPSLASQSSSKVPAATSAVVYLPSKPKQKKKEKVEDLLRKIETNNLAAAKKGKV